MQNLFNFAIFTTLSILIMIRYFSVLVLALGSLTMVAQETKYISEGTQFNRNEVAFLFGDNVKLRSQPNTQADVLKVLPIGKEITIIGITQERLPYDGIDSPWYQVSVAGNRGFILGALISLDSKSINGSKYFTALAKNEDVLYLKTRTTRNDGTYKENKSKLSTHDFSLEVFDNQGIEGVKNMLFVNYLAESCGVDGGGICIFNTEEALIKAFDFYRMVDGDAMWSHEDYIFPTDDDGIPNRIVYSGEDGHSMEDDSDAYEIFTKKGIFKWNGTELETISMEEKTQTIQQ